MTLSSFEIILLVFFYMTGFYLIFNSPKERKDFKKCNFFTKIFIIIILLINIPFMLSKKLAKVLNCLSNE